MSAGRSAEDEARRRRRREDDVRRERRLLRRVALVLLVGAAMLVALGVARGAVLGMAGGAAVVAALAVIWGGRGTSSRWQAGAAGERETAEALVALERRGFVALHDLQLAGRRWNVDHVVIGPPGVVVIETKRWRGDVRVGRRHLRVNGRPRDEALEQVAWQVEAVARVLGLASDAVAAFLCLTGPDLRFRRRWWRRRRGAVGAVRVGTPADLVRHLRGARRRLDADEVADLTARLARGFQRAR